MMYSHGLTSQHNQRTKGRVVAIIPARLGATRLPRKPLLDLGGEPLIWHVYRGVRACDQVDDILVASADDEILNEVRLRGGRGVLITSPCDSGTERVARAAAAIDAAYIINVQSDEPFVGPDLLEPITKALADGAEIATLAAPIDETGLVDTNVVKVIAGQRGRALYFSRAPIPGRRHIGIYGFKRDTLLQIARLPRGVAAQAEDLEQLTWLEANYPISVLRAPRSTVSIDTARDLDRARRLLDSTASAPRADGASIHTPERLQPNQITSRYARPAP